MSVNFFEEEMKMKNDNNVTRLGMLGKIKDKLSNYRDAFIDWIVRSDWGIFWIVLVILAVVTGVIVLVGLTIGMAVGIPALVLYLAFNAVVPVFGGPAIGYWTAVGIVILLPVIIQLLHGGK